MLRFKRPRPPAGYAAKARAATQALRADLAAGRDPLFDEHVWQAHKGGLH